MDDKKINELLNVYLKYDEITGNFFWIKTNGNKSKINSVAGTIIKSKKNKYISITFKNQRIYAHKLAWYYFNSNCNKKIIHLDGNCLNNRIENLSEFEQKKEEEIIKKQRKDALNYYYNNKKRAIENNRIWQENQRKNETDWHLKNKLRCRAKAFLKSKGIKKINKTENLIGCTAEYVIFYLKSMGYNPKIHDIDHILPLSLFDIKNEKHIKVMFHYSNLQPLDPHINRKTKRSGLCEGWEDYLKKTCDILKIEHNEILEHLKYNETREYKHGKNY